MLRSECVSAYGARAAGARAHKARARRARGVSACLSTERGDREDGEVCVRPMVRPRRPRRCDVRALERQGCESAEGLAESVVFKAPTHPAVAVCHL